MYYPYYEWILHGWYSTGWLFKESGNSSCSKQEYLEVVDRAIVIQEYSSQGVEVRPKQSLL